MITSSSRVGVGQYCITIDPLVNVSEAAVQLTPGWAGSAAHRKSHPVCGSGANTIGVWVWNLSSSLADDGYSIAVL